MLKAQNGQYAVALRLFGYALSLLTAIGMPELIAHSLEDYERLALALATDDCSN